MRFPHKPIQFFETDRLGQELTGSELHRFDGRFNGCFAGKHHDFAFSMPRLQFLENVQPGHAWHHQVEHDDIECTVARTNRAAAAPLSHCSTECPCREKKLAMSERSSASSSTNSKSRTGFPAACVIADPIPELIVLNCWSKLAQWHLASCRALPVSSGTFVDGTEAFEHPLRLAVGRD